jgi:hypothetical protein
VKITTGTPYWGSYDKEHFQCVMDLSNAYPDIILGSVQDCPYIDQAKSILATKYMDTCDVIVIIDHDMIFKPETVIQIAESAMEKQGVVGAAYGARMRGAKRPLAFIELPVTFFEGGSVVPASTIAGGFMAIPTQLLRDMVDALGLRKAQTCLDFDAYPFFHCIVDQETGKWWGEDMSFCRRVVQTIAPDAGDLTGKPCPGLYIDTRIRVGHKGSYVYHIEDGLMSVPREASVRIEEKNE